MYLFTVILHTTIVIVPLVTPTKYFYLLGKVFVHSVFIHRLFYPHCWSVRVCCCCVSLAVYYMYTAGMAIKALLDLTSHALHAVLKIRLQFRAVATLCADKCHVFSSICSTQYLSNDAATDRAKQSQQDIIDSKWHCNSLPITAHYSAGTQPADTMLLGADRCACT